MGKMLRAVVFAAAAAAVLAAAPPADRHRPPSQVFDRSSEPGTLALRLDRALAEAAKASAGRPFWVGYAIDRLQEENSHIGSFSGDGWRLRPTVADILAGRVEGEVAAPDADVKGQAAAALDRLERRARPGKKVMRELGFFLEYGTGRPPVLADVRLSNLDLSFDFEAAPLFWLGKAAGEESLGLIEALFGRGQGKEARRGLVAAAGCHGAPALVLPFLEKVLGGDAPDDLRKDAAFWIGQQNDGRGLGVLVRAARSDRSMEVREGAVFAISQVELAGAVDELIGLARGADRREVRKQAVFWLSQVASKRAGGVLEEIAGSDEDLDIREHAVFALSQLPDDEGLETLIRLAKTHGDPRIRKKAVFWLGESDDPRALEAIIAILKDK